MKPSRLNKVIGLALGEQSLMAAELVATDKGQPEVRLRAEMRYPDGVTPANPAELGAALGAFLKDQKFTARHAVVGLPAKWLIVKPKAVPPADPATLAELLRLQAEGEFSSELRDLTFDYAADETTQPTSVLLVATPQRYIDGAVALCEAAKLTAAAVTPSAVALGVATAAGSNGAMPIVMAFGASGAELTAQAGSAPSAIRHLRAPALGEPVGENKPFLGELRRAVSTLPVTGGGSARQMILWGTNSDATALGDSLGITVRAGDLPLLGVNPNGTASAGDGRQFAAAVALAVSAMGDRRQAIDFLHSRLAPPPVRRVPQWAVTAALALVALIALGYWANDVQQRKQKDLDDLNRQVDDRRPLYDDAKVFVDKVSFAKRWHAGNPRYLSCLLDLRMTLPDDHETYVTNLTLHEPAKPTGVVSPAAAKPSDDLTLIGRLEGKTSNQVRAQQVVDRLKTMPVFQSVKLLGTNEVGGRDRAVTFSVTFDYVPAKPAVPPPPAAPPHK